MDQSGSGTVWFVKLRDLEPGTPSHGLGADRRKAGGDRMEGTAHQVEWSWAELGAPPIRNLLPVRRPVSGWQSRHVPVAAFSTLTGEHIPLESGLEHDLVRMLDRDTTTEWLVSQPVELHFLLKRPLRHIPDLLSAHKDGTVTLWDVRPAAGQDLKFLRAADLTRRACEAVGWHFEVFGGLGEIQRMNLLWLHCYRHPPPWLEQSVPDVVNLLLAGPATVGDLLAGDDGSGELMAALWHLCWTGRIHLDLTAPLRLATELTLDGSPATGDLGRRLDSVAQPQRAEASGSGDG